MESVARMTENSAQTDLLAGCRNGDRGAFEQLFRTHQKRVFSVALNFFGGRSDLAEDVAQQVFLKLFRKIGDFRAEAEFTTWLYRVTVNACLDEQRRRRRRLNLADFFRFAEAASASSAQDEKIYEREISGEVQKALAALKPKYRLPILLKYSENLSYAEIAAILECSEGTVASRLSRGHKMLAEKLKHLKGKI